MTDYYISHSGNDGNAGTSSGQTWRTISHAAASIGVGDRVLLVNDYSTYGPYWAGNMINSASGYKGAMGVFTDAGVNFYNIDGLGNPVRPGDQLMCYAYMGSYYMETFWIVSVTDAHTLVLSGTPTPDNPLSYVIRDQSGIYVSQPCIYWNSSLGNETDNKWQSITSQDASSPAIIAGTSLLTRGTDCDLLWVTNQCPEVSDLKFDMTLGGRWGIRAYDPAATNNWAARILRNQIFGGNQGGQRGITINQSYKALLMHNDIYELAYLGIFCYHSSTGGTMIIGNKIHDFVGGSADFTYGVGIAGAAAGMSNATVIGNLIYNMEGVDAAKDVAGISQYTAGNDAGNSLYNTIYNIHHSGDPTKAYGFWQKASTNGHLLFANNIIKRSYYGIYVNSGYLGGVGYNCLHECTNNYGGANIAGPTLGEDVLEDPQFMDAAHGDFTPRNIRLYQNGLPLFGKRTVIGAVNQQLNGHLDWDRNRASGYIFGWKP